MQTAEFHNLRANPGVTFGGISMRATVISDETECDRIWALADRVFAPYATYRQEAGIFYGRQQHESTYTGSCRRSQR
jgi:hypothetical protein